MKIEYAMAMLGVLAIGILFIGTASAHSSRNLSTDDDFDMMGMMNGAGMMNGDFAHDPDTMRDEMKEHGMTDEEFDEMAEHCPMMRRR
ncbi:MAG: hypothetical protein QMD85_04755 [Candidatus Aenigmarchaeota archaeon]|nr:hypothetical protein [Candidatus Aenigmarchaeota archaeon]MDI6722872.1 hypothetical protein [Candidatus Aenigmarchaeota archaeon]